MRINRNGNPFAILALCLFPPKKGVKLSGKKKERRASGCGVCKGGTSVGGNWVIALTQFAAAAAATETKTERWNWQRGAERELRQVTLSAALKVAKEKPWDVLPPKHTYVCVCFVYVCMYVHVFALYCNQAQFALIAALKATRDTPLPCSSPHIPFPSALTTTSTYQCVLLLARVQSIFVKSSQTD